MWSKIWSITNIHYILAGILIGGVHVVLIVGKLKNKKEVNMTRLWTVWFVVFFLSFCSYSFAKPVLFVYGDSKTCSMWENSLKTSRLKIYCYKGNPYKNSSSLKTFSKISASIILFPKKLELLFGKRAFTGSVMDLHLLDPSMPKGSYCYEIADGLCLGIWSGSFHKKETFSLIKEISKLIDKNALKSIKDYPVSGWWLFQLRRSKSCLKRETQINAPIDYIKAKIIRFYQDKVPAKVFVATFPKKTTILSTLEGFKSLKAVGNYYLYPALWGSCKKIEDLKKEFSDKIGLNQKDISLLFTGADIDNIAFDTESHKDLKVWTAVTAGVFGNAMRAGVDKGYWLETEKGWKKIKIGTINILIFVNKRLTQGALASAVIRATEAKSAVLQELSIKSTYTPNLIATGTGTDNIIIVSGYSGKFTSAGGHTVLGYMIAKSVRKALFKAICLQNGVCKKCVRRMLSITSD